MEGLKLPTNCCPSEQECPGWTRFLILYPFLVCGPLFISFTTDDPAKRQLEAGPLRPSLSKKISRTYDGDHPRPCPSSLSINF